MEILALIPARGGSKGVPQKNIRKIGGVSLIRRAINAVKKSGVTDHILVSSDDKQILKEARDAGIEIPFIRPKELATDTAAMVPVIKHAIFEYEKFIGKKITTLLFLEATVPFRSANTIVKAVERYNQGDCNSVITVCPLERKPQNIFKKINQKYLEQYIESPKDKYTRRQDMVDLCRLSSVVYIVDRDIFIEKESLIIEPVGYVDSINYESINIDEEIDLLLAEVVAEKYKI